MPSWIGAVALTITVPFLLYESFSRLTHGRYTPKFYAYQLDRAPDDASTRLVSFGDIAFAVGMSIPASRGIAASLCALVMFGGVMRRTMWEDQNAAPDLALMLTVLIVALDDLLGA